MVVDGSLVSGDGYAGELGHTRFVHGDAAELCACGQWGCLETVASAAALARRYGARTGRVVDGAREVLELLAEGDPDAATVWEDALAALIDALVLYTTLVAPTRIAIGGGLVGAGETLLAPLREGVHARLTFQREPEIVAAELGEEAGCLGAALMAWDRVTVTKGSRRNDDVSGGAAGHAGRRAGARLDPGGRRRHHRLRPPVRGDAGRRAAAARTSATSRSCPGSSTSTPTAAAVRRTRRPIPRRRARSRPSTPGTAPRRRWPAWSPARSTSSCRRPRAWPTWSPTA